MEQATVKRYGPNELEPCGTPTARRRHAAQGKRWQCDVCWPPGWEEQAR